jgi:hypothetical protein
MQAWKILMELLLEVDKNSNKIAIEIILNLYNLTQSESSKLSIIFQFKKKISLRNQ